MIGNPYLGYKKIEETIGSYAIYFPAEISPLDLVSWGANAEHGDKLDLPNDDKKRHLICIEN
jgi:hypothetical protein